MCDADLSEPVFGGGIMVNWHAKAAGGLGRLWAAMAPVSLARRIAGSVALGLALILVLFSLVAQWTIQDSTEVEYRERVALAVVLASRVDELLRYSLAALSREASAVRVPSDVSLAEAPLSQLAQVRREAGLFARVFVVDANGRVVWADPTGGSEAESGVNDPGLQTVVRLGQPHISEVTPNPGGGKRTARLAVAVRDQRDQTVGALVGEIEPNNPALNLLPTGEVGDSMYAQLLNAQGQVLAGTADYDPRFAVEHRVLLADIMDSHLPGYRIHEPPPGVDFSSHIVAYAPVGLLPAWGVVVEQPKDLVLAIPRQLQQRLGLFALLALILAGTVAWLDASRVVRPLLHLTAAAQRFAAGQLDEPVHLDRGDELGILASAFETMRQRLRASLAEVAEWNRELERRVAARTAEVERLYKSLQARERERAELLQRIMAGQEEERKRLAQELHDEASQALAWLQLGLGRLASGESPSDDARELAEQLQTVAAQTLAEVHRLAVELRPSVLDDVGLGAAVQRYSQELSQRWGMRVDFEVVGLNRVRLIQPAETAIFRIVQAALTNVVQHAKAQHVSVLLQRRGPNLVVVVEDDGEGFDLPDVREDRLEHRLGLAGMEERARLIGGILTIESSAGAGTTVFLEVPLDSNCRREDADGQQQAATLAS